jgi:hypothetical protein
MKKLITASLILISLMLIVGLTQATATNNELEATNNSLEDRVAALEDTADLFYEELRVHEEHILALEDKVAALEDGEDQQPEEASPQLSEEQAVGLVQQALVDSLSGGNGCWSVKRIDITPCFLADPVLTSWHPVIASVPNWMLKDLLQVIRRDIITSEANWNGVFEAEQGRWRVEATSTNLYPGVVFPFHLDEGSRIVVGLDAVVQ